MSAMESIIRFSNVIRHLEQGCEQLIRSVSKLGWRIHWDGGVVRQANFPGDKAVLLLAILETSIVKMVVNGYIEEEADNEATSMDKREHRERR